MTLAGARRSRKQPQPTQPEAAALLAWYDRHRRRLPWRALRGETAFYEVEHRVKDSRGDWIWILSRAKVTERDADGRSLRVTFNYRYTPVVTRMPKSTVEMKPSRNE